MNWTPLIGRRRPLEIDALRLATLIHQLGEPDPGLDEGAVRRIRGEARLQTLDHLLRHPTTLAYVLIDQWLRRPDPTDHHGTLPRRIRQLLANEHQQHLPAKRRRTWQTKLNESFDLSLHPFVPPRWQRLDDVMAFLSSRDLVRVSVAAGVAETPPELSYDLTETAAELLERELYPKDRNTMLYLQLCTVIKDLRPPFDGGQWQQLMLDIEQHLEAYRRDEQLPLEQDPLSVLFYNTFQEHL